MLLDVKYLQLIVEWKYLNKLSIIEELLRRAINRIVRWENTLSLSFSTSETKIMVFTRRCNTLKEQLYIQKTPIEQMNEYCMILDSI